MPVFISSQENGLGAFGYYGLPMIDVPGIKASAHYCGPTVDADTRPESAGGAAPVSGAVEAAARAAVEAVVASTSRFVANTFQHVCDQPFHTESCLYTSTPDHDYLLGAVPDKPRWVLAGGGSGHAFKLGPAIGDCAAALALGGQPTLPTEQFELERLLHPTNFDDSAAGNK